MPPGGEVRPERQSWIWNQLIMSSNWKFDEILEYLPNFVDAATIREQFLSLFAPYDVNTWMLPLPLWAKRSYELSPPEAWEEIRLELQHFDPHRPVCIYLHIPFCTEKCDFCDSYSFKVGSHQEEIISAYLDQVCSELELWGGQGSLSQRPVSTVHLGGGTPNFVGPDGLRRIVDCCQSNFDISGQTEWALEATVASLTDDTIAAMDELGFRRLHIGVQTLQEDVRMAIGRRRPAGEVLEKVRQTLDLGWIVSVDLICGLPDQGTESIVGDIQALAAAGVNGFSLYELLIYPQNARWAKQHGLVGRSHLPNYVSFQAGALKLEELGYEKNLFNHWADDRDENIYFTFPTRNEDCLAVGTIADGVFGDLHYRHPKYATYMRNSDSAFPGLEGGLRRTKYESLITPFVTAVLSGWIPNEIVSQFKGLAEEETERLFAQWARMKLVEDRGLQGLRLTGNGSWFAGNMVSELADIYRQRITEV
jgi:coproporphyrinogen III oxidase-like Fe-S oxidoreductase